MVASSASEDAEKNIYSNVVDPFSAVFDSLRQNMTLAQWLLQEKARQIQKTMQNAVGTFHQDVIGFMPGWKNLGVGHVVDVENRQKKIIAEIKNKHNTTKGTDKKAIYDNLKSALSKKEYARYVAYYVEVVPKRGRNGCRYDKVFTPPDNVTGKQRPANDKIHVIDGYSFYGIASGDADALKKLYEVLPHIIAKLLGNRPDVTIKDKLFWEFFKQAY